MITREWLADQAYAIAGDEKNPPRCTIVLNAQDHEELKKFPGYIEKCKYNLYPTVYIDQIPLTVAEDEVKEPRVRFGHHPNIGSVVFTKASTDDEIATYFKQFV